MRIPLFQPTLQKEYQTYRSAGIELNSRMNEEYVTNEFIEEAGNFLGLYHGDTLVFDDENETSVLQDFILYECSDEQDRNIISHAREDYAHEVKRTQLSVLDAMNNAFTVLAVIENASPTDGTLQMEDLMHPGRKILLADVGCSCSATPGAMLFTRLLPLSRFHMTTGVMFVLPERVKDAAMRRYRRVSQRHDEKASQFLWREFLYFNRKRGLEVCME